MNKQVNDLVGTALAESELSYSKACLEGIKQITD